MTEHLLWWAYFLFAIYITIVFVVAMVIPTLRFLYQWLMEFLSWSTKE